MATTSVSRARILAGIAISTLISGLAIGATGAHATPSSSPRAAAKQALSQYSLFTTNKKIVSSSHRTLSLQVSGSALPKFAPQLGGAPAASSDLQLSTSVFLESHGESHSWSFQVTPSMFKADSKAGTGSIKTKTALGGFGKLSLAIKPRGKLTKTKQCSTLTDTSRPVTVSGKISFDTKSGKHGWGKVSTQHLALTGALNGEYGSFTDGCGGTFPKEHCDKGVYASVFAYGEEQHGDTINISASKLGGRSTVNANRTVSLSSGVNRTDGITTAIKALAIKKTGGDRIVTLAGANKQIKGGAIWSASDSPSTSTPTFCKNKTTTTSYDDALFDNAKKPVKFMLAITDPITIVTHTTVDGHSIDGLSGNFFTYS